MTWRVRYINSARDDLQRLFDFIEGGETITILAARHQPESDHH